MPEILQFHSRDFICLPEMMQTSTSVKKTMEAKVI